MLMPMKVNITTKKENYEKDLIWSFDFNNIKIVLLLLAKIVTIHIAFLIIDI